MYMNHKYIAWPFAFVTPLLFRLATPTDPGLAHVPLSYIRVIHLEF